MDEKIIDQYTNLGLSIRAISRDSGLSPQKIKAILTDNNIEIRQIRTNKLLEQQIFDKYLSGIGSETLAKEFNLSDSTICRIVKRLGGNIRPIEERTRQKYQIRTDFFKDIDCEEKAYILGFLYADGSVHKKTNMVKIEVHEQDIDILETIRNALFIGELPKIGEDRKIYRYITITNKQIKTDLIKHGCVPQKTFKVSMPKLRDDLMFHFLRGLYDGDGCISIDKNRIRVILTGYDNFLNEIKEFLTKYNINCNFISLKPKVAELTVSKTIDVEKFLILLYKDSTLYLNRKFNKYQTASNLLDDLKVSNKYCTNIFSYHGQKVTKKWLESISISERNNIAESAFNYFRFNGFPFPKYTDKELKDDFINLINDKSIINNNKIIIKSDAGLKIFRHYCHHYFSVSSKKLPSMIEAFNNDEKLMYVIKNRMGINFKECFNITGNMIRQGLRNSYTAFAASIFKPALAKLIYDTYAHKNSSVLDISAGFGQRMLGAAASNNVIHYTGIDPWTETIEALNKIHSMELFNFSVDLFNIGSEIFISKEQNMYDLCFSSPPFYDKEIYSYDGTQAYNNRDFDKFMDEWWIPTLKSVHRSLKPGSYFILNIGHKIAEPIIDKTSSLFTLKEILYLSFDRKHLPTSSRDVFYILVAL